MAEMYRVYQTSGGKWAACFSDKVVSVMGASVQDLIRTGSLAETERLAKTIARDSVGKKPLKKSRTVAEPDCLLF